MATFMNHDWNDQTWDEIDEMFSATETTTEDGLSIITANYLFRDDIAAVDCDIALMLDIYHGLLPPDAMKGYDPDLAADIESWLDTHHTNVLPLVKGRDY